MENVFYIKHYSCCN